MNIIELYTIYLETAELIRNRPDAVCTTKATGRNRSIFQRKMVNIKRAAESLEPKTPTEKVFLEMILGRKLENKQELVKVEWFSL